jgi:phosphinothricin acetyltransferase
MMIRAIESQDVQACLEIYSPFITHSAVSFELDVPTLSEFQQRVSQITRKYPWLVAIENNEVLGYAYASNYRDRLAYQWNVEVSVYVHADQKQKKIGQTLYTELLRLLQLQGFCKAFAVIAIPNEASVKFHAHMGFKEFALYEKVGFKVGKWHDVLWMQYELNATANPIAPLAPTTFK